MIGMFLDLPKAYKVLNHKILLSKSDACGIRGVVNLWIKSYLSNRKKCADISYEYSNTKISGRHISVLQEIKHDVPQSYILGQTLLLYRQTIFQ
jgi:hypothetical protein